MADSDRYEELAEVLAAAGAPLPLAELHGGLCGALCIGGEDAMRGWIDAAVRDCDAEAPETQRLRERLETLGLDARRALAGSQMSFEPLLPDEDRRLHERVAATASWCQGFLAGLALGGFQLAENPRGGQDQVGEVVADFVEISKAGLDAHELTEQRQAEFDLAEVTEYVRVGAQLVYEELAERRNPDPNTEVH